MRLATRQLVRTAKPRALRSDDTGRLAAAVADAVPSARPEPPRVPTSLSRPTNSTILAGFTKIFHPAALVGHATAAEAWYLFRRHAVVAPSQQFNLDGYKSDLRSPRTVDVAGAGNPKAWATQGGHDAFIVIGRNLGFLKPGEWFRRSSPLPILTGTANVPATEPTPGEIIDVLTFPTGAWVDASPGKEVVTRLYGHGAYPFLVNDTLDVALVVLASRVSSANATNYLDGFAQLVLQTSGLVRNADFD